MQSLVQIGEIAWEELKKVGLRHLANLQEKNGRWKWAWPIPRDSAQFTEYFECATKYMEVMSKNALSLIVAPPSGGN